MRLVGYVASAIWSFVAMSLSAHSDDGSSDRCVSIAPASGSENFAVLDRSGCYVLGSSLTQGWLYGIPEGGRRGPGFREMILVTAPDVIVDLSGHALSTNTHVSGVTLNLERKYTEDKMRSNAGSEQQLVVRNGVIQLLNDRLLDSHSSGRGVSAPERLLHIHARYTSTKPMPTTFPKVRYVLENLTIRTADAAAMLMGDGVIVRHCTIEVDGENALVIYGPNAIIEHNRIVFRRRPLARAGTPSYPEAAGAIYLRAADAAVVRGNTIELDPDDREVAAVAVVDSRGVIVEGNRFNRDSSLVVRRGTSTATLRANTLKLGWPRKDQALPNADLE